MSLRSRIKTALCTLRYRLALKLSDTHEYGCPHDTLLKAYPLPVDCACNKVGIWNNRAIVGWVTPLAAVGLLECANVNQLIRMWTERTSAGQSLWGLISVQLALWLWLNFYRVVTPNERFAFWGTSIGIAMNMAVVLTVVYFRYC